MRWYLNALTILYQNEKKYYYQQVLKCATFDIFSQTFGKCFYKNPVLIEFEVKVIKSQTRKCAIYNFRFQILKTWNCHLKTQICEGRQSIDLD